MTTYDLVLEQPATKPAGFLGPLKQMWANFQRRRKERATLIELSHLDSRLLRDVGLEPMDVYNALHGSRPSSLFSPWRRDMTE
jgi:uncharacterized protein YjiS (DUF1127 family)